MAALSARVLSALEALAERAAPVEDEQQYVADLVTVWGARVRAVASAAVEAGRSAPDGATAAVGRLVAEASAVTDPHRAIDWLSTLPQAAILALGDVP